MAATLPSRHANFIPPSLMGHGAKVGEVARKVGVSLQTMARWRARFSGMTAAEAKEKRRLEEENAKLKRIVAQYAMEIDTLKVCLGKKW